MDYFTMTLDPNILTLGPLQLRYYGIIFASMLYIGFLLWRYNMTRGGYSLELAEKYLIWGVIAVLLGSRLGHCFFYESEYYLSNPVEIFKFWKGGLASHGATVGLVVALITFAKKYKVSVIEIVDRFAMSAAVGAAAVRAGNFFNSEIVGRQTDASWAVRFPIHDCRGYLANLRNFEEYTDPVTSVLVTAPEICAAAVPRHPSQLYEFALGMFVLFVLFAADRLAGKEKRPRGLLAALFLIVYFAGRFFVEFVKEYQVDDLIHDKSFLTMGQYLSIVPFACGIALLAWSIKNKDKPIPEIPESAREKTEEEKAKEKSKDKIKKRKGKKR